MSGTTEAARAQLLEEIQEDMPLTSGPFLDIGRRCGLSERATVAAVRMLLADGSLREISALLDGRRLGYASALVAMEAPPEGVQTLAQRISAHPGVSHNYERDHRYNLWFTLAVPPGQPLAEAVGQLVGRAAESVMILPALRTFKLRVRLSLRHGLPAERFAAPSQGMPGGRSAASQPASPASAPPAGVDPVGPLSEAERRLLARMEDPFPITRRPWRELGVELGLTEAELFAALQELKRRGIIRRIAGVLRHRAVGYTANAMVCFHVPETEVERAGRAAAARAAVSHCYQRVHYPHWPYSLYAMVHARSREECDEIVGGVSGSIGCRDYQVLYSLREHKKRRIKYFGGPE